MATTTLPFLLISVLFLFISSSHISSCFATTTQQGQVPSSVTPKAAAVHYWHVKTRINKPLPPIFLSKLSTLSPTQMIVTNDETRNAVSNDDATASDVLHDGEITASYAKHGPPLDGDATASDVERGPPLRKYRSYALHDGEITASYAKHGPPLDGDATASDVEQGPPLKKYRSYALHDGEITASYAKHGPPLDVPPLTRSYVPHDGDATASDVEQGPPLKKYRSYATHDGDATASDVEQGPPLRKYRSYDTHDGDATASDVEQGPPLRKYRSYALHDGEITASYAKHGPPLDGPPLTRSYVPHDGEATASDVEQGPPLKKYRSYAPHDSDATASNVEQGPPLKKYRSYAPHDGDTITNEVEQGPPLRKYRSYAPHDGSATASADAKRATRRSGFDSNNNNNIEMVTSDEEKDKAAKQSMSIWRGIFFRESLLKEGTTIPLLKFAGINHSNQYFLPRSIASKIPFSVDAISKIYNIPVDSAMYRAVKNTIDECRMPPNIGETMKCVTSAEDIIDYAVSTLGVDTDIQVWSMHNWNGFSGKSGLIGNVKVVYDGELTAKNHVTCHKATFPYMVYHCHSVSDTRVYDIEVLDAETKAKINQAAAVCHLNTTGWDPDHMSFAALQSAPGKTEVCHWISPSDMVLTPNDVVAATATAVAT